jgi:hypothetical protein
MRPVNILVIGWHPQIALCLLSLFPVFNTPQLPDGTVPDNTFPLLAGPMHIISGILATWGIPRWST